MNKSTWAMLTGYVERFPTVTGLAQECYRDSNFLTSFDEDSTSDGTNVHRLIISPPLTQEASSIAPVTGNLTAGIALAGQQEVLRHLHFLLTLKARAGRAHVVVLALSAQGALACAIQRLERASCTRPTLLNGIPSGFESSVTNASRIPSIGNATR
eukprot:765933-Hanusia_phi.AAC.1